MDAHRDEYGVEPICSQLPIALSPYYEHDARQAVTWLVPLSRQRGSQLFPGILRVWDENSREY